jgi:hypothetical protein
MSLLLMEARCILMEMKYCTSYRESEPTTTIEMGPGDACIVGKGYWHRVTVLDFPAQFIHITPGLNRDYRPL